VSAGAAAGALGDASAGALVVASVGLLTASGAGVATASAGGLAGTSGIGLMVPSAGISAAYDAEASIRRKFPAQLRINRLCGMAPSFC